MPHFPATGGWGAARFVFLSPLFSWLLVSRLCLRFCWYCEFRFQAQGALFSTRLLGNGDWYVAPPKLMVSKWPLVSASYAAPTRTCRLGLRQASPSMSLSKVPGVVPETQAEVRCAAEPDVLPPEKSVESTKPKVQKPRGTKRRAKRRAAGDKKLGAAGVLAVGKPCFWTLQGCATRTIKVIS